MSRFLTGAIAGAAATIPMSWAMELMHRTLPRDQRQPLPPREITDRVTAAAGVDRMLDREQRLWLALASHLAYGAAAGAAYSAMTPGEPQRPLTRATGFGVLVWAASYLGLLPAMGILSPATRHAPGRNALMIAAHIVWGSAVGLFSDLLERGSRGRNLQFLGARQHRRPHPSEIPHKARR